MAEQLRTSQLAWIREACVNGSITERVRNLAMSQINLFGAADEISVKGGIVYMAWLMKGLRQEARVTEKGAETLQIAL